PSTPQRYTLSLHDALPISRRGAGFLRRVQMVFQDPYASLHPRKMVDKVLREPLQIHGFDRQRQRIDEVLVQVGLDPSFRYRYPQDRKSTRLNSSHVKISYA